MLIPWRVYPFAEISTLKKPALFQCRCLAPVSVKLAGEVLFLGIRNMGRKVHQKNPPEERFFFVNCIGVFFFFLLIVTLFFCVWGGGGDFL